MRVGQQGFLKKRLQLYLNCHCGGTCAVAVCDVSHGLQHLIYIVKSLNYTHTHKHTPTDTLLSLLPHVERHTLALWPRPLVQRNELNSESDNTCSAQCRPCLFVMVALICDYI